MAWCEMERVDGPCRPENSFYRFEESLEKYYLEEIPETERKLRRLSHAGMYVTSVSRKFYSEVGSIIDHKVIEPLAPHELPAELLMRKNYTTLGAWLELQLGIIAVDERLKGLIEGLEPGVHRFWPLRLVKPNGQDFPATYYGIVIDRFLDSFLPEATKKEAFEGGPGYYSVRGIGSRAKYNAMTFSANTTNGSHLWRERQLDQPNIFISDELNAAIDAAELKMPTRYKVKTLYRLTGVILKPVRTMRDLTHTMALWLLDVIAPDRKTTGQEIANFRREAKEGELRLHPQIAGLVDPEMLERMGAVQVKGSSQPRWAGTRAFGNSMSYVWRQDFLRNRCASQLIV